MTQTTRLGVVMDPIAAIKPYKDTTLALLLEAQRRDYSLWYMEPGDLYLRDGEVRARMSPLRVADDNHDWYRLGDPEDAPLAGLDQLLMRQDPPVTMEFHYTTMLLARAAAAGLTVLNRPSSLLQLNEKLYAQEFPALCAPTLVTRDAAAVRGFAAEQGKVVLKPLDGMGGQSIFVVAKDDPNLSVILDHMTGGGRQSVMAQRYLPEIADGDKRILMVAGEPVPYALARIPAAGETRGNIAAGGRGEGRPLTDRDREICAAVGPELVARGLWFVGLDVIGDSLTEINITSPTCVRELDNQFDLNIAGMLFDAVEAGKCA